MVMVQFKNTHGRLSVLLTQFKARSLGKTVNKQTVPYWWNSRDVACLPYDCDVKIGNSLPVLA